MLQSENEDIIMKARKEKNQVWCIITEMPLWGACFVNYYHTNAGKHLHHLFSIFSFLLVNSLLKEN